VCDNINGLETYRMVKWSVVRTPKEQGGLSVHDLQVKNCALLGKWLFKLLSKDGVENPP
jgi:hypothetical protein